MHWESLKEKPRLEQVLAYVRWTTFAIFFGFPFRSRPACERQLRRKLVTALLKFLVTREAAPD